MSTVKRFSKFVLNDEKAFALELQSIWNEKQEEKPKHSQSELQRCQKRYDELSSKLTLMYYHQNKAKSTEEQKEEIPA